MNVHVQENIGGRSDVSAAVVQARPDRRSWPKRMLPRPDAFEKSPAPPKAKDYRVVAQDLYSFHQFVADTIFIIGLSCFDGILFAEMKRGIVGPVAIYALVGLLLGLLYGGLNGLMARNRFVIRSEAFHRIREAVEMWTLAVAAFVFLLFMLKAGVLRGFMLSLYFLGLPSLAVWRVFSPLMIAPIVRRTEATARASIVIGDVDDPLLDGFCAELKAAGHSVSQIIRFQAACFPAQWANELKMLLARVSDVALNLGPGEIYICSGTIPSSRLSALSRKLALLPRAIFVVPDAQTSSLVRCKPAVIGRYYALEVRREPLGRGQRAIKRVVDIVVSATALVLLSPFFAAVAVAVKLDSPGEVFFRQSRNGYQGRPFKIWKFRSMRVTEDGPDVRQVTPDDPRVTRLGKFLRRTSIDELPQLINVLQGTMSLVGPRPHARAHDEFYARSIENYEVRQHVKPGLTGWAQVNGLRGETATVDAMYKRIEYDLWYAINASTLLDIEILFRTVLVVLRQRNAY